MGADGFDLDAILTRANDDTMAHLTATTDVESRLVDVYRQAYTVADQCRFCEQTVTFNGHRSVDYANHMIACREAPQPLAEAMREYLASR